ASEASAAEYLDRVAGRCRIRDPRGCDDAKAHYGATRGAGRARRRPVLSTGKGVRAMSAGVEALQLQPGDRVRVKGRNAPFGEQIDGTQGVVGCGPDTFGRYGVRFDDHERVMRRTNKRTWLRQPCWLHREFLEHITQHHPEGST